MKFRKMKKQKRKKNRKQTKIKRIDHRKCNVRWSILFIFCLLVPHGMNEIVFGERRGRGQETILARKISLSGIFIEKMASE